MNKIFLFLLFYLLSFYTVTAQNNVEINVVSAITHTPVSFCTVQIINKNKGTLCDENGKCTLQLQLTDTVKFSCIGYNDNTLIINKHTNNYTVYLTEKPTTLADIAVVAKDYSKFKNETKYGIWKRKTRATLLNQKGCVIVLKIENPTQVEGIVKEIKIGVSNEKFKPSVVRLHFYSINPLNGYPGEELLNENVIVNVNEHNPTFNVEKYKIPFKKDGIFAGFEWLKESQSIASKYTDKLVHPQLHLTYSEIPMTFDKSIGLDKWTFLKDHVPPYGKIQNAVIQITVLRP